MAHSRTWNAAYEATPPNNQLAAQGAQRVRELKTDISERLTMDHVMDETDDDGYHKQVTFEEQASAPGNLTNKFRAYGLEVDGKVELHLLDEDGNEFQLTDVGKLFLLGTNNSWTKGQATTDVEITYGSTITPDASLSNSFWCDLTGNIILEPPDNPKSGQVVTLALKQDATGSRTLTFGTTIYGNASNDWELTTTGLAVDELVLQYDGDATRWRALALHKDIDNAL